MKVTASQMAKNPDMIDGLRVYVVSEAEGLRPANRKDHAKRCATAVKSVTPVEGTRLYDVLTGLGRLVYVQGSQWFDVVDEETAIDRPALPPVDADVSTEQTDAQRIAELLRTIDQLEEMIRAKDAQIAAELTIDDPEGYCLAVDQVGILHAMIEGQDIMCETETRTLDVIVCEVFGEMRPGRKVCPKCAEIIRNPDSQA